MKLPAFSFALIFFIASCQSQQEAVYRIFDKELDKSILTFDLSEKGKIEVSGQAKQSSVISNLIENLHSTSRENFYYFKIDSINEKKGLGVLEFIEQGNALCFYIDTSFLDKTQIEKFISVPQNLEMALTFFFIKNVSLENVKEMAPVKNISPEKLIILRQRNMERINRVKSLPKDLEMKDQFKLFAKQQMWLNMECLLLGYKFPQTSEEQDWVVGQLRN